MPEAGRRERAGSDNAPPADNKSRSPQHYPELTEEVTHAGIPALDQPVAGNVLEEKIPALEETIALFEKNVPVLDETADPSALSPGVAGDET